MKLEVSYEYQSWLIFHSYKNNIAVQVLEKINLMKINCTFSHNIALVLHWQNKELKCN